MKKWKSSNTFYSHPLSMFRTLENSSSVHIIPMLDINMDLTSNVALLDWRRCLNGSYVLETMFYQAQCKLELPNTAIDESVWLGDKETYDSIRSRLRTVGLRHQFSGGCMGVHCVRNLLRGLSLTLLRKGQNNIELWSFVIYRYLSNELCIEEASVPSAEEKSKNHLNNLDIRKFVCNVQHRRRVKWAYTWMKQNLKMQEVAAMHDEEEGGTCHKCIQQRDWIREWDQGVFLDVEEYEKVV